MTAKDLLLSPLQNTIENIMTDHVISVSTLDDQEQIALMFSKYGFIAMPVVDNENRLVGIITVDDAIDVMHEETEEDFAKMAAVAPTDTDYLKTSPLVFYKARIPWLLLLMVSATFTGMIISNYETALAALPVLTAFIPMIMDTSGNSGSQTVVTVIRGISLGEIEFRDFFRVVFKEFSVSILCGATLFAATVMKLLLVDRLLLKNDTVSIAVALTVGLTIFAATVCSKVIASVLPQLAKKAGADPAVLSSPLITTIVDALSLLIYFGMATLILHIGA